MRMIVLGVCGLVACSSTAPTIDGGDLAALGDAASDASEAHACQPLSGFTFGGASITYASSAGSEYWVLAASSPEPLRITLYDGTTGGFTTGATVALSPCTPTACASEVEEAATFDRYGLEAGSFTLTSHVGPQSTELTGTLSGLVFRRIDASGALEPDGPCLAIASLDVDSTVPLGSACTRHDDCGNDKVCDIDTQTCAAPQCTQTSGGCVGGKICVRHVVGAVESDYCAQPCDPYEPCPADYACRLGICLHAGAAAAGDACGPTSDTVTSCGVGLTCVHTVASDRCAPTCDVTTTGACDAADRCQLDDDGDFTCAPPPADVSSADLDAPCTLPAMASTVSCADDGSAYRGLCETEPTAVMGVDQTMCRRICYEGGPVCPMGETCLPSTAADVLVCR